jgi:nitroreductase
MSTADSAAAPAAEREAFDVFLAMRKRRMHRNFLPEPVDEALLARLVYAAGRASSARAGLRHLVIVTDPRLMKTVRLLSPGFLNNAPALIAICTDTVRAEELIGPHAEAATLLDSGGAAAYLSVAAPALGLGICYVTSWPDEAIQGVLSLPPHIRPDVLVAVGHPVPAPVKAPRRFQPIVHRERFDRSKEIS